MIRRLWHGLHNRTAHIVQLGDGKWEYVLEGPKKDQEAWVRFIEDFFQIIYGVKTVPSLWALGYGRGRIREISFRKIEEEQCS